MKKSGECKGNLRSAQKIFRVMKMMCFLMFVLLVQVRGDVVAQNQVVSVDMKNCSVEEFLREIKEQTGIRFMYKSEYVEAIPRFDVHAKERQVLALLDEVFAGKGIKCLYDNGVIVLTKVQQQKGPEEVVIKGVVKDEREQPLPGVTVLIKGTTIGVATDSKGEFSLTTVKQDSLTLLFSFIVTTLLIVFAEPLCNLFFNNTQAGVLLRIMAPIVPLMYLDSIVDGMLKGLDQQVSTLKYNFSDSLLRVLFIAVLLPVFGMKAYVFVLFFSEIFNASLSIHRLLKVTDLTVDVVDWVLLPAVTGALLYYFLSFLTALI